MQKLSLSTVVFLCAAAGAVYVISLGSRPHPVTAHRPQQKAPPQTHPHGKIELPASVDRTAGAVPVRTSTEPVAPKWPPLRAESTLTATKALVVTAETGPAPPPTVDEGECATRSGGIPPQVTRLIEEKRPAAGNSAVAARQPQPPVTTEAEEEQPLISDWSFLELAAPTEPTPAVAPRGSQTAQAGGVAVRDVLDDDEEARIATSRHRKHHELHESPKAKPTWVADPAPARTRNELLPLSLPPQVAVRTEAMFEEAMGLADRGALYAARQQFLRIMRVTCQSLDAQIGRSVHSAALVHGLKALEEADDFALTADAPEADVYLKGFIAGHRTPILKDAELSQLTALTAMQQYYKYAYEQLALAGNDEPISSDALYSLGRIEALLSEQERAPSQGGPKALALYHAALTVYPNNALAANELAVMLARRGRWQEARRALLKANQIAPTTASLTNLAKVEQQLGNVNGAQYASQQARRLREVEAQRPNHRPSGIQWVDNGTFNRVASSTGGDDAYPVNQQVSHAGPMDAHPPVPPQSPRTAPHYQGAYDVWDF